MKECADCGSNEIVKNCKTGKIFCYDCKSERVYGKCFVCREPVKEEGCKLDGNDSFHHNNKKYGSSKENNIYSCYEEYGIQEAIEADCS